MGRYGSQAYKGALYHDLYVNFDAINDPCWLLTSAGQ